MKNGLLFLSIILILGCNSLTKSKIDANFLIGGEWCGESELAGGQICLEFMESKAYLTVKREKFYNPLDYTILKIDEEAQTIDWEFSGEGTLNVFKIISQDTIEFKQLGAQNSATFIRRKVKY
ncbi:hypothetical protein N9C07_07040 [Flavobacteriaceae bacterium]|mgnify:FL=1|nr:hypothetical protein [Flavobacteriaceae bacterium]MDC1518576.1 hypothetical protein [Flavobacteriaceae bacterium]MDC1543049.1 hypothetical protein [Flavobacteriaceae bacterium]